MDTQDQQISRLETESSSPSIRVLLIDDQAMVGEAVRRVLADQSDIELHYIPDAMDAIEQAARIRPTVILLDLLMPNIDGLEVISRFRSNAETARIPVVVLSTTDNPLKKSEAFGKGADDYLVKLPDKVELVARIRYHSASYQNLVQRDEAYRSLSSLNEAYQLAKTEAEQANQAKSEFLSRMSHELRTPLNAILGFGQILELDELDTRQRDSVVHILNAGTHLLALINEMLDIARIESGRMTLSLEPVRASEILDEAMVLIRPMADSFDIKMKRSDSESLEKHVIGDSQRLRQVIINLLSNAVKYNRRGGSITVTVREEAENVTRISVRDTGFGIAEEDLGKLFTPFERLHADKSSVEGTGLGLALSKRLMEAMDGTLTASSVIGEGSAFEICLPTCKEGMASAEVDEADDLSGDGETAKAVDYKTILLIEDNVSNASLMEVIFANRPGNKLMTAMQARIGLDLAQRHRPDLILLDLNLPDMSGQEVLRKLKEDPATRQIPIVIVSADATPHQIERLLGAGAQAYVTKPINVREFVTTLNEVLR